MIECTFGMAYGAPAAAVIFFGVGTVGVMGSGILAVDRKAPSLKAKVSAVIAALALGLLFQALGVAAAHDFITSCL